MKFSFQFKTGFLLVILVFIFIIGLLLLKASEDHKISLLVKDEQLQKEKALDNSIKILGKDIHHLAYDYSYWDEMVDFVKNPDQEWAEINILAGMTTYNANAVWVYSNSYSLVYASNQTSNKNLETLPVDNNFFKNLNRNYFPHFFTKTTSGLMEIFGAPIQPSADLARKTSPQGFLFVGRILSEIYLKELSSLSDSKVKIILEEYENKINPNDKFSIINTKVVYDWDNKPAGYFLSVKKSTKFEKIYELAHFQYTTLVIFSVIVIISISILLYILVNNPVRIISKSLSMENISILEKLRKKQDEFGRLASLITQFFIQKDELAEEISTRRKTEENLLQLHQELESLVGKRTAELASVNKELEMDILEREKIAKELQKLSTRFMKLFYTSPDAICIVRHKDGLLLDVNKGFTEITGYLSNEIIGRTCKEIKICDDPTTVENLFDKVLEGRIVEMETSLITKTGDPIVGLISASSIEIDDEQAVIIIIRDITERKKMEEQLLMAKQKAENSDKLKSEFLAQMSHEIRSPINSILSFTGLLKSEMEDKLEDDLKISFSAIDNAGARIIRTIDLILNMSEIQNGIYEPNFRKVNLMKDIVNKTYLEFRHVAQNKNLQFEIENKTGHNDFTLFSDEYTVMQIFNNLVNNAIKYTEKGSVKIVVKMLNESNLLVEIADTGIGISEEYMEKIFNPFTQEEQGYTRRYEGNGLGLSLVKKYCEINNFKINVESTKSKGSIFRLVIPCPYCLKEKIHVKKTSILAKAV